jgi:hypothetical protein
VSVQFVAINDLDYFYATIQIKILANTAYNPAEDPLMSSVADQEYPPDTS